MEYGDRLEIYSMEWEKEENLPVMDDISYDHIYHYSKIGEAGMRMFPFITIYDPYTGAWKRIYLGA